MPPDTDDPFSDLQPLTLALATLTQHIESGLWDDQPWFLAALKRSRQNLLWAVRKHREVERTTSRATMVGCPTCGQPPDHYCVTNTGNVYDSSNGPPYFHAARRRVVSDLEVTDA